jgi:hypothetical protein
MGRISKRSAGIFSPAPRGLTRTTSRIEVRGWRWFEASLSVLKSFKLTCTGMMDGCEDWTHTSNILKLGEHWSTLDKDAV